MLDVTDRLAVIIGGGRVAVRKARGLIEAGATRIRMVSPRFRDDVPASVERLAESYEARHLEGSGLVFAATDSAETNDAIVRDARLRGVLVNRADADDEEPGDFTTPAVLRNGAVVVTTAGAPALAVMIRDELARTFEPRWSEMAEAMRRIRPAILASQMSAEFRRNAFRDLATADALAALSAGGSESLWRWLLERYPELSVTGGPPVAF
jgi:precorrin-2 dehydrogenase/sirohydrochlorin ferrochelatase